MNNYRPISLLPILSKVIKSALKKRLMHFLLSGNLLSPRQFGFRSGRSTTQAVATLIAKVLEGFERHQMSMATFLDLSKAFERVSHARLLEKLQNLGLSAQAFNLMESYLANRYQVTKHNGEISSAGQMKNGVPQGSILGPILFLVYVNDFLCSPIDECLVQYADDTTFCVNGNCMQDLQTLSGDPLAEIEDWWSPNSLTSNKQKTETMVFSVKPYNMGNGPTSVLAWDLFWILS